MFKSSKIYENSNTSFWNNNKLRIEGLRINYISTIMPAVEVKGDESGGVEKDDEKTQQMNAFQNLQNHFLALQSEQVGEWNFCVT